MLHLLKQSTLLLRMSSKRECFVCLGFFMPENSIKHKMVRTQLLHPQEVFDLKPDHKSTAGSSAQTLRSSASSEAPSKVDKLLGNGFKLKIISPREGIQIETFEIPQGNDLKPNIFVII